MSIVLVSESASFAINNSMFVVDGNLNEGYTFDKGVFFMLGLKEDQDYCFLFSCCNVELQCSSRFIIGGDSIHIKYEAFLHDEVRISEVLTWICTSIIPFQNHLTCIDVKPLGLLEEFNTEEGFYSPDTVLQQFIIEFPEFKAIDV
jgi:hypothetical protein